MKPRPSFIPTAFHARYLCSEQPNSHGIFTKKSQGQRKIQKIYTRRLKKGVPYKNEFTEYQTLPPFGTNFLMPSCYFIFLTNVLIEKAKSKFQILDAVES